MTDPTPNWLEIQRAAVEGALGEGDHTVEQRPASVVVYGYHATGSWSLRLYHVGRPTFTGDLSDDALRVLGALGAVCEARKEASRADGPE